MKIDINKLMDELGNLPQVEAIALGGSRATGKMMKNQTMMCMCT